MKCPSCGSVTSAKSCRKCGCDRQKVVIDKPWDKNATFCAEWEEQQAPRKCIKQTLFSPACDAVKVLQSDPEIKSLVECSQRQVMATASYHDEETGITVPLKILIDLLPDKDSQWGKSIVDFKTADSAALRAWRAKMFKFNYDAQAALYLDVWEACTGEDRHGLPKHRAGVLRALPDGEAANLCRVPRDWSDEIPEGVEALLPMPQNQHLAGIRFGLPNNRRLAANRT